MRVIVAPDSFGGTLSAAQAAAAIAAGWRRADPTADVEQVPLADGGPGFIDVLTGSVPGARTVPVRVRDPLGRAVSARLLLADGTAYVESAQAAGLHLLAGDERDPERTGSLGVGDLVRAALDEGAGRVVVGLGGSGTNDGGAGLLVALGARLLDAAGRPLPPVGGVLRWLARIEAAGLDPRLRGTRLVAATDVDNPLLGPAGATAVFGPQKGASGPALERLEASLRRFAEVLERDLPGAAGVRDRPGAGAAGGLGAALLALGATRDSGITLVLEAVRLAERVRGAGLVVTGEGSYDEQSLRGKAPAGVAALAQAAGVPCIVLAGRVRVGRREMAAHGVAAAHALVDIAPSASAAMAQAAAWLEELAAQVARGWRAPAG